uniref:Uncharacterized protein n=1 Tax=Phalaenopsis equestris Jingman-related virus TaxID=2937974 RepID=A0AAT9JAE3_9FLAV
MAPSLNQSEKSLRLVMITSLSVTTTQLNVCSLQRPAPFSTPSPQLAKLLTFAFLKRQLTFWIIKYLKTPKLKLLKMRKSLNSLRLHALSINLLMKLHALSLSLMAKRITAKT